MLSRCRFNGRFKGADRKAMKPMKLVNKDRRKCPRLWKQPATKTPVITTVVVLVLLIDFPGQTVPNVSVKLISISSRFLFKLNCCDGEDWRRSSIV